MATEAAGSKKKDPTNRLKTMTTPTPTQTHLFLNNFGKLNLLLLAGFALATAAVAMILWAS